MPVEYVFQAFFREDRQRFAQAIQHRYGRGIGEIPRGIGVHHVGVIEIAAFGCRGLGGLERSLAHARDTHARRQHQALLGTADADIDAPFVHAEVDAGKRAHRVDE